MGKPATTGDYANDDETAAVSGDATDELHTRVLKMFDTVAMGEQEERAAALEDRRFATIAGAQWEGDFGEQFENSIKVEIDKTSQGVERIMDQYRANRSVVNFRAVDKDASEETAETLNGMFRADYYRSGGKEITDSAFEEAVLGGYGAWRLTNEYVDERDPDDDRQQISFVLIPEADQCVFFVGGRHYTKRDAKGCYVISAMTVDEFEDAYPDAAHTSWPETAVRMRFDWYGPDTVRVAEYYEVEEPTELLRSYEHKATGETRKEWAKDQEPGADAALRRDGWEMVKARKVKRRRVHKWILSGMEVLEDKGYIAGCEIPVIPVYGKRRIIDNIERVRGHVRKAKDAQRVYNAQVAKLTETASLSPMERPIFAPEQMANGIGDQWARANIDRAPYALANPLLNLDGSIASAGPVGKVEAPQISPALGALIQITASDIAEMTNSDDQAAEVKSNVSAEAMDIAATRIDDKAFTYIDNMDQSWQRCGEVYLGMAREVYVEEDREVETMDPGAKSPGIAVLSEGVTDDKGAYSIQNDIAKGKYKVISDVTEANSTRRDKTVRTLFAGAQAVAAFDPDSAQAMNITAMLNMDGEGMHDLQAYLRKKALGIGLVQPTDAEKQEMQDAAQNQAPDPAAEQAKATTEALAASAEKEHALAGKAVADTELSKAKTVETMAKAHAAHSGAQEAKHQGVFGRLQSLFQPVKPQR